MDKVDLGELAERVEKLDGPDREVDAEIAVATDWRFDDHEEGDLLEPPMRTPREMADKHGIAWLTGRMINSHSAIWRHIPHFTASLDAAMSLVPEGWAWQIIADENNNAHLWRDGDEWTLQGHSASPALALTAAALRARLSTQQDGG